MNTSEIANFEKRVEGYVKDNLVYIAEYNDDPTAQDLIEHWDTNGPEGIGEELTGEQRDEFLITAGRVLRDEKIQAAWEMLQAHLTYDVNSVAFTELTKGDMLRSKSFSELLEIVGKTEKEVRDEFQTNGTLL